uniref:Uncharacterized protein n=1 Tax=Arundo donax TaxID=35708 RepID=A0A0A8YIP7_ARUDO
MAIPNPRPSNIPHRPRGPQSPAPSGPRRAARPGGGVNHTVHAA